jgi:hypothetical protein
MRTCGCSCCGSSHSHHRSGSTCSGSSSFMPPCCCEGGVSSAFTLEELLLFEGLEASLDATKEEERVRAHSLSFVLSL